MSLRRSSSCQRVSLSLHHRIPNLSISNPYSSGSSGTVKLAPKAKKAPAEKAPKKATEKKAAVKKTVVKKPTATKEKKPVDAAATKEKKPAAPKKAVAKPKAAAKPKEKKATVTKAKKPATPKDVSQLYSIYSDINITNNEL